MLSPLDLLSQTNQVCGRICLILVTCNCLPFSWPRNWLLHGVSKQKEAKPLLRFSSPHQLVVFLVKDPLSLLCGVWSYGHVLQWQKKALAASQWCLYIVEPTACQRQRIIMKENQTKDIFYRLVSQTSCSILKCLVYKCLDVRCVSY